jgi:hypothetical protein
LFDYPAGSRASICTFNQGRIAERGAEAQQFRASGLNLVIAAIAPTPLTWEHIGFSGDFLWERAAAAASRRRPLNLGRVREAA